MNDFQISDNTIETLVDCYMQEHRHYHNLEHIDACLEELQRFEGKIDDSSLFEVVLMISFHDAVYEVGPDVKPGMNEHESAGMFMTSIEARAVGEESADIIYDGILHSARHTETIPRDELSPSQMLFLDIDLHGMGKDYDVFLRNGENIRKEFAWVNDTLFRLGRIAFFHKMLERSRIYYTDDMYHKYEANTRKNIQRWLEENV